MILEMVRVRVLGPRDLLEATLEALQLASVAGGTVKLTTLAALTGTTTQRAAQTMRVARIPDEDGRWARLR